MYYFDSSNIVGQDSQRKSTNVKINQIHT